MSNETKLQKALSKFKEGDKIGALSIVSKFKRLGDSKHEITLAMDCHNNINFYKQLGKDTKKCIENGIIAMESRYGW